MVYSGISSVIHLIRSLKETQDLGSPLFNSIREGNWLMDYIIDRFKDNVNTQFIAENLKPIFDVIKDLPRRAKPR